MRKNISGELHSRFGRSRGAISAGLACLQRLSLYERLSAARLCFVKSFSSFSASGNPHFHHEEFLIFSGSIKGGLPTRNQGVSATRFRAVVLCYLLEDHCSSGMQLSVVSACPSSSSFQFNQAFRYAVFSDLVMPFI